MEILLVVIIFVFCLIALNKKIDNVRTENQLNIARINDLLNGINNCSWPFCITMSDLLL